MFKKIIIYLIIFGSIGELMTYVDFKFNILAENRVVKIATDIDVTPEFEMIKNNKIDFNANNLRIMVIGDSYIHGGGIAFKDNVSHQLKNIFKTSKKFINKPISQNYIEGEY